MSDITTDPTDSRLSHGVDSKETKQSEAYLVLSDEERAKGFIRPVRSKYIHVGSEGPKYPLRELTDQEKKKYADFGYEKYEVYPESELPIMGRYWTKKDLDSVNNGCKQVTCINSREIAETYASNPKFYGSTYCVACQKHLPVAEFVWEDGTRVGS